MPPITSLPFQSRALHPLRNVTVLQIIPGEELTPSCQTAIEVAAALSAVGARALVACTARLKGEVQAQGGIFLPLPSRSKNPLGMALGVRCLARLIEAERVDIVHVRSPALGWIAYGATRLTKTPLVTCFGRGYEGRSAIAARYNSVLARGDLVLAESNYAAGLAAKRCPQKAGKIRVIPRGVDCQVFAPSGVTPARVEEVRRQWRVAPHEQVVLMPAPICPGSGHTILIEAARLLSQSGLSDIKFLIFTGRGEIAKDVRALDRAIAREGLRGVVYRASYRDVPAAFLAATAAVIPATSPRALGEAAVQAQAMGTPVIAANLGAARELILAPPLVPESARTGYLVPPGDAPALALAIAKVLMLGATARSQLAGRAIAHVEKNYSSGRRCAEILKAYSDVRRNRER
jgi:glycosyltransferase involved in cell wall biosynthesis